MDYMLQKYKNSQNYQKFQRFSFKKRKEAGLGWVIGRCLFLAIKKIDFHRRIVSFNSLHEGLKGILGAVPLFRDRDYQKYPQVAVDDVLSERFCSILPFFASICCKNGVLLKVL